MMLLCRRDADREHFEGVFGICSALKRFFLSHCEPQLVATA